ncbi:bifunctional diguanylate cyclase/phosphodiesterase [Bradyrhizobium prioriisuperbiae]|uniref:bifunctional diguanylate cyclase/phosphodiesterase n=1 Tax=Bradyrhizobium prioriisuperbiae TaxID=2854389 RepID=UPI0028E95841|nr:EAL domain-containing protein [Bradyrhizobium prioritasuperba]
MQMPLTSFQTQANPAPPGRRFGLEAKAWQLKRWLIVASIVVSALFLVATIAVVFTLRAKVMEENKLQQRRLALVLAEQLDRSFQSIELVQQAIAADITRMPVARDADFKARLGTQPIHDSLRAHTIGLPHISGLTIRNADGELINSSFGWPIPDDVLSPNPAAFFRANPNATSTLGEPLLNPETRKLSFFISRRLSFPDKRLAGYVNGTMDLDYFEDYFASVTPAEHASIALFRDDGTLLVRFPREPELIGKTFPAVEQNFTTPSIEFRRDSAIDGRDKLIAIRRLEHYPVRVVVTSTVVEALALWRRTTQYIVLAAATVLTLVALLAFFGVRRFTKVINSSNAQFTTAINNMSKGLVILDRNARYIVSNDGYVRMYGLPAQLAHPGCDLRETLAFRIATGTFKGDPDVYLRQVRDLMATGRRDEYTMQTDDGRLIHVVNEPIPGGGYLSTHDDITASRQREESFKLLFENNPIAMWVYDQDTLRFLAVNDAAVSQYGFARNDFVGRPITEIRPPEDRSRFLDFVETIPVTDYGERIWRHQRADNSVFEVRVYSHALSYEGKNARIVAAIDVTAQREAEKRIAYIAHHDKLTDLPNRSSFDEHFTAVIAAAAGQHSRIAVMCLDLDGFKQINDLNGHSTGDQVLRAIAERLQATAEEAFLARVGGDEFTLIGTDNADRSQSQRLAERLIAAVQEDFFLDGQRFRVGLSIGIAVYPDHGTDTKTLLGNADLALYRAKAKKRGTAQYFNSEMDVRVRERRAMQEELRGALQAGEISLHYQPQVAMRPEASRQVIGYEALARWTSKKYGNVSPDIFMPLAEESELIADIGEWILRDACREARSWREPKTVAVNISPRQFQQIDLPNLVQMVLLDTGLPASRLELEITEGVLIEDFARAVSVLRRLKALGVEIALDDFGTGYSSLSYLHAFTFDRIKIDRKFVMDLDTSRHSQAIVRAVIGLGQSLNVPVLAEGVETEAQFALLAREGCHAAQGYLTGRPQPPSELFSETRSIDTRARKEA